MNWLKPDLMSSSSFRNALDQTRSAVASDPLEGRHAGLRFEMLLLETEKLNK